MVEKKKKVKQSNYSLLLTSNGTKVELEQLQHRTLLDLDFFTTDFVNKYEMYQYLKDVYKLKDTDRYINFDIRNERNNTANKLEVYYSHDRGITNRELIRDQLMNFLGEESFRKSYLMKFYKVRDERNKLRQIAIELLTSERCSVSEFNFLLQRFMDMIDKDGGGLTKAIRDAYPYVKRYEGTKIRLVEERINETNEKAKLLVIKEELEKTKNQPTPEKEMQMSLFDHDFKRK